MFIPASWDTPSQRGAEFTSKIKVSPETSSCTTSTPAISKDATRAADKVIFASFSGIGTIGSLFPSGISPFTLSKNLLRQIFGLVIPATILYTTTKYLSLCEAYTKLCAKNLSPFSSLLRRSAFNISASSLVLRDQTALLRLPLVLFITNHFPSTSWPFSKISKTRPKYVFGTKTPASNNFLISKDFGKTP